MANVINATPGHAFSVYASAARTATPDTMEFDVPRRRTLTLVIDVTAVTATPSVVFTIQGVDRVSGKTFDVLVSAAITGTGTTVLRVNDALTAAANTIAKDAIPPVIRITAVHGDADSITYSVAALTS